MLNIFCHFYIHKLLKLGNVDLLFKRNLWSLQIIKHSMPSNRRRSRSQPPPVFVAEPINQSNSFVGTEEYIAPVG